MFAAIKGSWCTSGPDLAAFLRQKPPNDTMSYLSMPKSYAHRCATPRSVGRSDSPSDPGILKPQGLIGGTAESWWHKKSPLFREPGTWFVSDHKLTFLVNAVLLANLQSMQKPDLDEENKYLVICWISRYIGIGQPTLHRRLCLLKLNKIHDAKRDKRNLWTSKFRRDIYHTPIKFPTVRFFVK